MISTKQALKEWDRILKLLAEVKAHAAAHPDNRVLPASLASLLNQSVEVLAQELASPVATWKQLLKAKVGNMGFQFPSLFLTCTQQTRGPFQAAELSRTWKALHHQVVCEMIVDCLPYV
jgi:hypothetical protein